MAADLKRSGTGELLKNFLPFCDTKKKFIIPETNETEILHEQFRNYLFIANSLMTTLKRPRDCEIGRLYIKKCIKLHESHIPEILQHTNEFFRYFLKVLKRTSETQPLCDYENWYGNACCEIDDYNEEIINAIWVKPQVKYVASKCLTDGTVIFFVAVACNPLAGWRTGGLKMFRAVKKCQIPT